MSHKEILTALLLGAIIKVKYGSEIDDIYFLKLTDDGFLRKCYSFNYGNFEGEADLFLTMKHDIEIYEQQQPLPLDNQGMVKVEIDQPTVLKAYKNGDAIIFSDQDKQSITLSTLTDTAKFERFSNGDLVQNYLM